MKYSVQSKTLGLARLASTTSILLLTGCGPDSGEPESGSLEPSPEAPLAREASDVGTASEEVVPGATDVSSTIAPNSTFQGETAAVAFGAQRLVAYNSDDTLHKGSTGDHYCLNYSAIAASYNSNGTWRGLHIPTPNNQGVAMLRSDPAVTVTDSGTNSFVWVSSLAVTTAAFNAAPKQTDGCLTRTAYVNQPVQKSCYSLVVVPKNGSAAFVYAAACVSSATGTDELDGSAIHGTPGGNVYAAYWNYDRSTIEVFQNGGRLPNPFPGATMVGHPKFAQHAGNIPTLMAPDTNGNFWVARFNESASTWLTVPMSSATSGGTYQWGTTATLGSGQTISTGGYSGDVYGQFGFDALAFFYPTPKNNKFILSGIKCSFLGTLAGSCAPGPGWTTKLTSHAIFPTVAVATVGTNVFHPDVTYWSDNGGTLTLNIGRINTNTDAFTITPTSISQVPCVFKGFYWGDYDGMTVHANGSNLPILVRYFSDSTGGTCNSEGLPQHVSEFALLP